MIYGVILGIIFGIGTAVLVGIGIWGWMDEGTARKCIGFILAPIMFILFLCIPFSFHQVDAGEVAVVKHMGQIVNTRSAGTYFDFWMTNDYITYDAKVQNIDIDTQAYSKDAQTMDIAMTVQFQIQAEKAKDIASQYGDLSALENKIRNVVIEKTKSVLTQYSAMEIIENRSAVSPEVEGKIKSTIDDSYYISITTVVLSNIDFSDVFEKTVEDKMVAEQEKLKAEYEKQKAIIEAEKELEVAKLQAQARIAAAEGEADAQRVIANAEAYATQIKIVELARAMGYKIKETEITEDRVVLDEEGNEETEKVVIGIQYTIDWKEDEDGKQMLINYLQYLEYLSKWNGELPGVVAGDSLNLLIPSQP